MAHWSDKFADISSKAWIEALRKEVQDPEQLKKVVRITEDGAAMNALYFKEDTASFISYAAPQIQVQPTVRLKVNLHKIEEIAHLLSPQVQLILEGAEIPEHEELHQLLHAVNLEETPVHYQFGESNVTALYLISDFYENHGIDTVSAKGSIYFDPVADLYTLGNSVYPKASMPEIIKSYAQSSAALLPSFKTFSISAYLIREAGGTPLQEMVLALGQFVLYMDWLTEAGIEAEKAVQMIQIHLGTSDDIFVETAKYQAFQFLLSKLLMTYQIKAPFDGINVVATQRNKTMYSDEINNWRSVLDITPAFFTGLKDITLFPQDETFRYPIAEHFEKMIELYGLANAQLSSAHNLADAYWIQVLTSKLAEAAWDAFLEMEQAGGVVEALAKKSFQAKVELAAAEQKKAFIAGQKQMIGVNTQVNLHEFRKANYDKPPIYLRDAEEGFEVMPLRIERLVEAFEIERLKREGTAS